MTRERLGFSLALGGLIGVALRYSFSDDPFVQISNNWFALVGGYVVGCWLADRIMGWWK